MVQRTVNVTSVINENVGKQRRANIDGSARPEDVGVVPDAAKPYIVVTEEGDSLVHRTILTITALPISITDDAGVAQYGGAAIYNFPEGLIYTKGFINKGALTLGITGTIIAAFTGVNALGSATASTGSTLLTTEATFMQSTANATASASVAAISSVSAATQLTESSSRIVDGTTTPAQLFMNFAIADDASHTSGTGSYTGVVTFCWEKIGDR